MSHRDAQKKEGSARVRALWQEDLGQVWGRGRVRDGSVHWRVGGAGGRGRRERRDRGGAAKLTSFAQTLDLTSGPQRSRHRPHPLGGGRAYVHALPPPKPNRSGHGGCAGNGEAAPSFCTEVAANLVALETEIIIGRQLMATPRVGADDQTS